MGVCLVAAQMALGLSPEQKERLLAARTYLLAQMMEIISERTAIINMLQVCICSSLRMLLPSSFDLFPTAALPCVSCSM